MGVELEGCAKCSKYLLVVFNVVFFLVGIALLAVGVWVIVQPYQIEILEILDNPLIQNSAYLIIALGCFIIVVSGLGCCGACMNSKCLLIIYFSIILIIFIAQIVGCALVIAYRSQVNDFVTNTLQSTMNSYTGENGTDSTSTGWNALQILLECCGTNGKSDWQDTTWFNSTPTIVIDGAQVQQDYPLTCCVYSDKYALVTGTSWPAPANLSACYGQVPGTPTNSSLNDVGCYQSFENFVTSQISIVGGVGLGLLVFELLSMIFAIALCRGISQGEDVV